MRVIAHLSDLHFGRVDPTTLPALQSALIAARPDLLIVSGDLTQRARRGEFEAARSFLDSLPFPRVIVPGNHDIPLHNVFARATAPFRAYRRAFANELEPFFIDQEIAVLGINTARALTFKNGRINVQQVERSCARLEQCGPAVTRVIVTHHPFDVLATGDDGAVIGRAGMAMTAFARCRVDLILSGHLHVGYAAPSAVRYSDTGWASLLVQAGTATSTRRRGEVNAFNLIRIDRSRIAVESLGWAGGAFSLTATAGFQRGSEGWSSEPPNRSQHTMSPPA
jgi:3',5'-cyclic AMP phosphodiesterase CpdA